MIEFLAKNYIEIIGVILSLIYLYLSIKQKIGLWLFGLLSALMYIYIFFESKFYADMTLQFYYVGVSIYGWISWKSRKTKSGMDLPVKWITHKQFIGLSLFSILVFLAYYFVLAVYTDSPVPIGDSVTTSLSITATWMLARKILEHWLLWVFIDAFSAYMYIEKGLHFTAILFVIYTFMAVLGYFQWKRTTTRS